jgi:hypothetical protein
MDAGATADIHGGARGHVDPAAASGDSQGIQTRRGRFDANAGMGAAHGNAKAGVGATNGHVDPVADPNRHGRSGARRGHRAESCQLAMVQDHGLHRDG